MKTSTRHFPAPSLAATTAPEDLRPGEYVAVLNETWEYPSFLWCGDAGTSPREEPIRIRWRPQPAGVPLKVKAVCLPFVFVEDPHGQFRTADVRQTEFVRLQRDYARLVWKSLRRQRGGGNE